MSKINFGPKNADEALVFAVEELRADIQYAVLAAMKREGISQARLAERLNCSPAAVSQFLDDDANLTLESIAKLFLALGKRCKVEAVVLDEHFDCVRELSAADAPGPWLEGDGEVPTERWRVRDEELFAALLRAPRSPISFDDSWGANDNDAAKKHTRAA